MKCEDCKELMLEYLYEELDAPVRADFERAIQGCPECLQELEELQSLMKGFDTWEPAEVPGKLHNDILRASRVQAEEFAKAAQPWWSKIFTAPAIGALAAAAAVVVASTFALNGFNPEPAGSDSGPATPSASEPEVVAVADEMQGEEEMAPGGAVPEDLRQQQGQSGEAQTATEDEFDHQLGGNRPPPSAVPQAEATEEALLELAADTSTDTPSDTITNIGELRYGDFDDDDGDEAEAEGTMGRMVRHEDDEDRNTDRARGMAVPEEQPDDSAGYDGGIGTGAPSQSPYRRNEVGGGADSNLVDELVDREAGSAPREPVVSPEPEPEPDAVAVWDPSSPPAPAEDPAPPMNTAPDRSENTGSDSDPFVDEDNDFRFDNRDSDDDMVEVAEAEEPEEEEEEDEESTMSFAGAMDLYNARDYGDAIDAFEEYLASSDASGDDAAQARYYLGMAYFAYGNNDRAERALERFLESHPNHELAGDAREILEQIQAEDDPVRRDRDSNDMLYDAAEEADDSMMLNPMDNR